MARPTTLRGSKLLVKLGDGGSPEIFTAPCALATKSFNRSTSTNDFNVADCDDPDAPIWIERAKSAISGTISGSGTLAQESLAVYESFLADQESRNVQIVLDYPTGPQTYEGSYLLNTLNISGEQDGLVQVEIELQSTGAVTLFTSSIELSGTSIADTASPGDIIGSLSIVGGTGTPVYSLDVDGAGRAALDVDDIEVGAAALDASFYITVSVTGITPPPPAAVFAISVTSAADGLLDFDSIQGNPLMLI